MLERSDDLISEQAYLVVRGVRPLAIIGTCEDDPGTLQAVATRLKTLAGGTAIPVLVPGLYPGNRTYGYASHAWVVDLLGWALSPACTEGQRHRIIGLLLGYSPDEIRSFEELGCGQRAIWSRLPDETSSPHTSTVETCAHEAS